MLRVNQSNDNNNANERSAEDRRARLFNLIALAKVRNKDNLEKAKNDAKVIIESGISVNEEINDFSAFMQAILSQNTEMVKFFLENGAIVNNKIQLFGSKLPLHHAIRTEKLLDLQDKPLPVNSKKLWGDLSAPIMPLAILPKPPTMAPAPQPAIEQSNNLPIRETDSKTLLNLNQTLLSKVAQLNSCVMTEQNRVRFYIQQIDKLSFENRELLKNNSTLTSSNERLKSELNNNLAKQHGIEAENTNLRKENADLKSKNLQLTTENKELNKSFKDKEESNQVASLLLNMHTGNKRAEPANSPDADAQAKKQKNHRE